ncbi:MAG: acetyl/propionyl/methylcrotonyl-CoA carboxylase subunit alpha [Burkholderiales bacterium]|nr:acetyl/propionyl/methylcrotonyl-CoA carboxylase subunit alpha [Burkholderiales bacterium]
MFRKLLVANRGEIACRVIAAARDLGIRTVAVFSDADAGARHVAMADEARCIGPAPARSSYLDIAAILAAAKASGAEAIHPGYGFLSENAEFARACERAGIVFVGPTAEAIAAMGDKAAAKSLMAKAGVPVVPGYHGDNQDAALLAEEARRIGYPVLIKASAGGGGKGMRVVERAADFRAALEAARREAKAAFGDDRVLLERYLLRPRHIEFQVFADRHGNVVHLFERDCSVQRRHQKVIEEAPAPGMTDDRRRAMGEAAVAAARAIGYVGAGTVEFIAEADGRFWFMEMNTRLQVEHPVTEMITGVDLVKWQIAVAAGEPLPLRQEELRIRGHAIEARIYAENPERGFLPSTGRLRRLRTPRACEFTSAAPLRIDSGVREADEITPHYDPMIAKLIAWGETRAQALARLRAALAEFEIVGVASNVEFLGRLCASRAFAAADLDTGLIERSREELFPVQDGAADQDLACAALAELFLEEEAARAEARASGDPYSPWCAVDGWRLNLGARHEFVFREGEREHRVALRFERSGYRFSVGGREYALAGERDGDRLRLRLGEASFCCGVFRDGSEWHVFRDGRHRVLSLKGGEEAEHADTAGGTLTAPMPGKVIQVLVEPGAVVAKGAPLLVLEAMKMEHTIAAPHGGRVAAIHYRAGEQVAEGAELLRLEPA